REVKDYPDRYVPLEEFTAIQGRDLKANLKVLGATIKDALDNGGSAEHGLALPKEQLRALWRAFENDEFEIEIVLGRTTNLGEEGAQGSKVVAALRANIKKVVGKDVLKEIPAKGEIERIDEKFEEPARTDWEAQQAKKKATP
ncbi:MAG TPA: hypothetical protein VGO00_11385, partial [Kofleriaceae bacterium]|nr:hypothetical protein [Kofleriaceae bacterium]